MKYLYVRFRWRDPVDLEEASMELGEEYEVKQLKTPEPEEYELSLYKDYREEHLVRADTLGAYISPFKAVLYQRERAPFTKRDVALRARLLELYPENRSTPLPWLFSVEPKYEVERKEKEG